MKLKTFRGVSIENLENEINIWYSEREKFAEKVKKSFKVHFIINTDMGNLISIWIHWEFSRKQ